MINDIHADRFAKTFRAKADAYNLWEGAWGIKGESGDVEGAIIFTFGRTRPRVINLQLLHTFFFYRGRGVGRILTEFCLSHLEEGMYFRVSAEPDAVEFYRKLGLKFWGKQKSGCYLCLARYENGALVYEKDPYILSKLRGKAKGTLVEEWDTAL